MPSILSIYRILKRTGKERRDCVRPFSWTVFEAAMLRGPEQARRELEDLLTEKRGKVK